MRAVVLHEHGDIDNLKYHEDYTDPECGEDQVIIRVKATSLNYHDVFTTKGIKLKNLKILKKLILTKLTLPIYITTVNFQCFNPQLNLMI